MRERKYHFIFLRGKALKLVEMPFSMIFKAHSFQAIFRTSEFQLKELINLEFIFIEFFVSVIKVSFNVCTHLIK